MERWARYRGPWRAARRPDSQGSQFFIVLDDAADQRLDPPGAYVIFGQVIEGMEVVDAIVARGPA